MPVIDLTTEVRAPVERIFDLARSVELRMDSTAHTGERAIAGMTSGLLALGHEVTWARHFENADAPLDSEARVDLIRFDFTLRSRQRAGFES